MIAVVIAASFAADTRAGDLKNVIKDLFGGDGVTLAQNSGVNHAAHFTAESLEGLDQLNQGLVSGLRFPAFSSVVTGFTLDLETGEPIRTTDSLGPLLAESAFTLGENRINVGASFTYVRFTHFQGTPLDQLGLRLSHPDVPNVVLDLELDEVVLDIDLKLEQEILAIFANYGVTSRWDVGIIIPIISTRAEANAVASVFDPTPNSPSPHFFDSTSDSPFSSTGGQKTGIGDIVLRTKYLLVRDHKSLPDMALGGQVILPTGDEDNLLGVGETQLLAKLIMSKAIGAFTPHLNLGYEYVPGDDTLSNMRYIVGVDIALDEYVTIAFDLLGRWAPDGNDIGDHQMDLAFGVKIAVADDVLIGANVLIALNREEGLRAAYIFTVGVEFNF